MKVNIVITFNEQVDSWSLWEEVCVFGNMNVTDMGVYTYVYGHVEFKDTRSILAICSKYGKFEHEITAI